MTRSALLTVLFTLWISTRGQYSQQGYQQQYYPQQMPQYRAQFNTAQHYAPQYPSQQQQYPPQSQPPQQPSQQHLAYQLPQHLQQRPMYQQQQPLVPQPQQYQPQQMVYVPHALPPPPPPSPPPPPPPPQQLQLQQQSLAQPWYPPQVPQAPPPPLQPQYQPQAQLQPQQQPQQYTPAKQVFREQPTLDQQQVKVQTPQNGPAVQNILSVGQVESTVVSSGSEFDGSSFEKVSVQELQSAYPPVKPQPRPPSHEFKQAAPIAQAPSGRRSAAKKKTRKPKPSMPSPARESVLQETMSGDRDRKEPNTVFLSCCRKKRVNKKCESRCNFDIMNKKVLTGMFLGTDPCPQSYGRDLMSCAAQDQDHTPCCRKKGVHETSAGAKCLGFCNMTPGSSFQADVSMLPCWAVLNDIKDCFKEHIEL